MYRKQLTGYSVTNTSPILESVFYIDADIICVNDPLSVIIQKY